MISTIHQWTNEFTDCDANICALPVADYTHELTSLELEFVANAVAIRRHTYSTGRVCAKNALSSIGIDSSHYPIGLLRQEDGSVAWPDSIIGSISHTDDWAMAAVMKPGEKYQSIGIDIEKIDRVDKGVLRLIATDRERAFLDAEHSLRWGRVAVFSIKESIYKCLRPLYGEFFGFKDVELANLVKPQQEAVGDQASAVEVPPFYCPTVDLLLPKLAACCDKQRIDIRLAVLDTHVVSFVGYR